MRTSVTHYISLKNQNMNFKEELTNIRAFVFDVDGVFTDARFLLSLEGEQLRMFNMRDGLAVVHAVRKGYTFGIISGGRGAQLKMRMEALGIEHLYFDKAFSKLESLHHFCEASGIPANQVLYMGDDYPDIPPMRAVRIAMAPADAIPDVKAAAHHTSSFKGGEGCVRDAIEQVLRARGDWFEV